MKKKSNKISTTYFSYCPDMLMFSIGNYKTDFITSRTNNYYHKKFEMLGTPFLQFDCVYGDDIFQLHKYKFL